MAGAFLSQSDLARGAPPSLNSTSRFGERPTAFRENDVGFWKPHQALAWQLSGMQHAVAGFDVRRLLAKLPDASGGRAGEQAKRANYAMPSPSLAGRCRSSGEVRTWTHRSRATQTLHHCARPSGRCSPRSQRANDWRGSYGGAERHSTTSRAHPSISRPLVTSADCVRGHPR